MNEKERKRIIKDREEAKRKWDLEVKKAQKKEYRQKILYAILTFLLFTWTIFSYIIGTEVWIPVDNCEKYYIFFIKYLSGITFPILLFVSAYMYYKITKKSIPALIVMILSFVHIIYAADMSTYLNNKRIDENLSIVKQGIIYDKLTLHYGGGIWIYYWENSKKKKWFLSTETFPIKQLSIGDTM
jgi:hypothetical protein